MAAERFREAVGGREVAELAGRWEFVEMLLGGWDVSAEDPYVRGSLARLYRDLFGVSVASPRRLAARLRDGLSLSVAGRGIVVEASETRFLGLVRALGEVASRLASVLGVEAERVEFDTGDPMWGVEALRRLLEALAGLLPPWSREALALWSASAPAPLGVAARAGGAEPGELEELGYRVSLVLPGGEEPGEQGLLRRLGGPAAGSPLELYRCAAGLGIRLLQLSEVRTHAEIPDPLEEMIREAHGGLDEKTLDLLFSAAEAGPEPRLPLPGECGGEAPGLPAGVGVYRGSLGLEDVEITAPGGRVTYTELVSGLAPLLYRGLAGLQPSGDKLEWWAVLPRRPLT